MSQAVYLGPGSKESRDGLEYQVDRYRWRCGEGHEDVEWDSTGTDSVCWYCGTNLRTLLSKSAYSKNFYGTEELARLDKTQERIRRASRVA